MAGIGVIRHRCGKCSGEATLRTWLRLGIFEAGDGTPYDNEVHWTAGSYARCPLSMVIHAFDPSGFAALHYHVPSQLAMLNNTSSSYTAYAL